MVGAQREPEVGRLNRSRRQRVTAVGDRTCVINFALTTPAQNERPDRHHRRNVRQARFVEQRQCGVDCRSLVPELGVKDCLRGGDFVEG